MSKFQIVEPSGRRRLWRVVGQGGVWTCDSQAIAKLVAKRLRSGKAPGWAAHDLRHGKGE